jgi:hypothetical protein
MAGGETGTVAHESAAAVNVDTTLDSATLPTGSPGLNSIKFTPTTNTGGGLVSPTGLAMATICGRFRLKATLANTGADAPTYLINCYNSGGTFMFAVQFVWLNASSTRVLRVFGNTTSLLQMGSDYVLPDTNWHTIQFKAVLSATVGEAYLWVDGTQVVNVTGLAFTSTLAADKIGFIGDNWTGTAPTGSLWVDDIIIDDAVVPGIGWQIARQGVAGTPTDTSANWVLVTGANIQASCHRHRPIQRM